ncbi:heparan-alpha-glucosaminide N-acetyltransferase isoform X2 [Dermacentor albipictus]|uniref:heparan-alpha-glucosaminide N-acetyltransferase isoform X2 n=1 Tax=Dermacentor albipictus TaxID=60249 RepID=UPI0038FC3E8F
MCDKLKVNQACVTVHSAYLYPLDLYAQTSECYGVQFWPFVVICCARTASGPACFACNALPRFQGGFGFFSCTLQLVRRVHHQSRHNFSVVLGSIYETEIQLRRHLDENPLPNCTYHKYLGEHGSHLLRVSPDGHCDWQVVEEPVNVYNPLIVMAAVLLFLVLLWQAVACFKRLCSAVPLGAVPSDSQQGILGTAVTVEGGQAVSTAPPKKRLNSLDAFRGFSLMLMVFVNYGGGKYWFFHHSPWNGITFADLVFPWFVWIMGVSLAMTIRSLLRKSVTRGRIFLQIVKRTLILFGLGIVTNTLSGDVDINMLRIPGVLQRLAFSYLVAATIHLLFAKPHEGLLVWAPMRDVLAYWPEWLFAIPILVLHLALTFFWPVPNCPQGYLGPGGLHQNGSFENCTGGAAGFIDRTIFGKQHLYQTPDVRHIYDTHLPYDPEGTLGCLTSIFLVFLGLQAGKILLTFPDWKPRVVRWCCWGLLCGIVAGVLCKFSKEDGWIPVNKNLWSVSFILFTASTAFFLLAILYYLIDVCGWWSGAPLVYPGMNSLAVYMGHEIMHGVFPWAWQCRESHWCYLFMNFWGTALWVVFAWLMFRRKLFISA